MDARKYGKYRLQRKSSGGELIPTILLLAVMAALVAVFSSEPNVLQSAILDLEIFGNVEDVLEELREILGWSWSS